MDNLNFLGPEVAGADGELKSEKKKMADQQKKKNDNSNIKCIISRMEIAYVTHNAKKLFC